jgi:small-conductance mechanosensitive channel
MNYDFKPFYNAIQSSYDNFIALLPAIFLAVVVFSLGLLLIKQINKYARKIIQLKSNDPLIADFILNLISFVLTVSLLIICLGFLGFSGLTNKILAGAGLTTFVIGFALKDIGENFLAGILMAFQRPFRIGDLIEIIGIKGNVIEMSLRSTTIKTPDGRDVFIPNGAILKNPLENFTIDDLMREELTITVGFDENVDQVFMILEHILKETELVLNLPMYNYFIDRIEKDLVYFTILYWYRTDNIKVPGSNLKSRLYLAIYSALKNKEFNLPNEILSINNITTKDS